MFKHIFTIKYLLIDYQVVKIIHFELECNNSGWKKDKLIDGH